MKKSKNMGTTKKKKKNKNKETEGKKKKNTKPEKLRDSITNLMLVLDKNTETCT